MSIFESIRIALRSLAANKMRSALTMLGIIIGVGAVITLMAIGRGAQSSILSSIQANGTNLLYITPGSTTQGGVSQGAGSAATLTLADANALKDTVDSQVVADVAPEYSTMAQLRWQSQNTRSRVTGVTSSYAAVRNVSLTDGDWIADSDVSERSAVCVLGPTTAGNLFGDADVLDQQIKVNGIPCRVIGITLAKGGTGFGSMDDMVYMPITTLETRFMSSGQFRGQTVVSTISVQVTDSSQMQAATDQITEVLRERHNLTTGDNDFRITSQNDVIATLTQTTETLTIFLGGIAAISLVVGGIGIMNIMLVSVSERTREIGIRKAVGAKKRDILMQFMTEAVVLSVVGGMLGIAIGWGVAEVISGVTVGSSTLRAVVDPDTVLLATAFSTVIGLFFGIYPANRAASLNPIEALRYE